MRARSSIVRVVFVVGLVLALGAPATARDTARGSGGVPEKNFSYVHADVDWVVDAFRTAKRNAADGDFGAAVRVLQDVVDATTEREQADNAAPYVVAVDGGRTFEGAFLAARHEIARLGDAALSAYEAEFGGAAEKLARAAIGQRDLDALDTVAKRFLSTRAGFAAALLRVDLALEAGDRDTALGWLEAMEDLDDVGGGVGDEASTRRAQRIARHAHALAKDERAVPDIEKRLTAIGPDWTSLDAVPWRLRYTPPPATAWPTSAGDRRRDAIPPAMGSALHWAWSHGSLLSDSAEPDPPFGERPSVWLPPRAVVANDQLFVSDGQLLLVIRIGDGTLLDAARYRRGFDGAFDTDEDRRERLGLLEGHALTVVDVTAAGGRAKGQLIYSSVPSGEAWPISDQTGERTIRNDRLEAFHWDGKRLQPLWIQGGALAFGGLDELTRLYGAPVLYRDKLWVAGIRPGVSRQWEAWLFGLDPLKGTVITKTHIGTGTPVRRRRQDEVVPTSPAADRGRVVIGTSLGMVGAVDASDGRVLWVHRYDREVDTDREKRNAGRPAEGLRTTGFSNEPPVLALDRCFLTPPDGTRRLQIANRPRGPKRVIETVDRETTTREIPGLYMSAEHIAGVDESSGTLVLIGRGQSDPGDIPGPVVTAIEVVGNDPGRHLWSEPHPSHMVMEPWGRALMTEQEVFVPSQAGIAVYSLKDGSDLGLLDRSVIPADQRDLVAMPYGNLIPVPGRGIVAVSATTITFWRR